MAYYEADAAIMIELRARIEDLGVPLVLMRKYNQLIGAITVQIEDEYTSRQVVSTVFIALRQQAEGIRQPERDLILGWIADCQQRVTQRLEERKKRTEA